MLYIFISVELPDGKRQAGNLEEHLVRKIIQNTTTGENKVNVKEITTDASTTVINFMSKSVGVSQSNLHGIH